MSIKLSTPVSSTDFTNGQTTVQVTTGPSTTDILFAPAKPAQQKTAPTSVADTHARQQQIMEQNRRNDKAEAKRRSLERKRILDEQRKIQMEENRRRAEQERLAKQKRTLQAATTAAVTATTTVNGQATTRPMQFNQVKPKAQTHGHRRCNKV